MTDYLEISVGRQDGHAFNVGRDEQGPFVFVRDPRAQRFEVSMQDAYLQVAAMPSAPVAVVPVRSVYLRMFVVHPTNLSATLRGDFDLHRMAGGDPDETIVEGREWVWRFSPTSDPYAYANYVSMGQVLAGIGSFTGVGPLLPDTDYRMTIYWMSQPGSSYNALQTVDFTTDDGGDYYPDYVTKRLAGSPEW